MLRSWLDYEEQHALQSIVRHHGLDDEKLVADLATFCNWTRADEAAKSKFGGPQPPYLLVLLSLMGIHGGAALTPERKKTDAQ